MLVCKTAFSLNKTHFRSTLSSPFGPRSYLGVAGGESIACDDATLPLCPGLPVRVVSAGTRDQRCVHTAWGELPAVAKCQGVNDYLLTPCCEVVVRIAVVVSAKTTHATLSGLIVAHTSVWPTEQPSTFMRNDYRSKVLDGLKNRLTLNSGLSLMNMLVFLSHIRMRPLLASITR